MYKIINWELADHSQITLINKETNKVVAHFLIDNDYVEKLAEATLICNTLNKTLQASTDTSKLLLADVSFSVCPFGHTIVRHWCLDCKFRDICKLLENES